MVNALSSVSGGSGKNNYPNFFPAAQHDFAARMKWSVTPKYADANHAPVVLINGPLKLVAYAGQQIKLFGSVSDPDGNAVSVRWWHFDMNNNKNKPEISNSTSLQAEVLIPKDAILNQVYHLILEATDKGSPALTSYQRVIITVKER
jgi:hypothetical protein